VAGAAIRIRGLSKRYRIGERATYGRLTESVASALSAPFRHRKRDNAQDRIFWALRNVSFDVAQGEAVGVIGRNGAGKTTLLKILSRITEPTDGEAELRGRVGSLLEVGTGFHQELTGRENIFLSGAVLGMRRRDIARKFDEIVDFAELERFIDTPVKRYSTGMYMRLAFSVAAHMDSEILLVDEVLAVGDVAFRRKCLGKMENAATHGRTILFVSHDLDSIRSLCPRTLLFDEGRLQVDGDSREVTAAYLRTQSDAEAETSGRYVRSPTQLSGDSVAIDWVELRDSTGATKTDFDYGDQLDIYIHLVRGAPRDGFTVEWILVNEADQRISFGGANPMCGTYFNRDTRTIRCTLTHLPLTAGTYHIRFVVRMWGGESWDDWDRAAHFKIVHCDPYQTGFSVPTMSGGDFVIPQRWQSVD
jgi:lipopolysaccharide transport system ATP-binding protein